LILVISSAASSEFRRGTVKNGRPDVFLAGQYFVDVTPEPRAPLMGENSPIVQSPGDFLFSEVFHHEQAENLIYGFDLMGWAGYQDYVISLKILPLAILQFAFGSTVLVNEHPSQPIAGRPAQMKPQPNQSTLACEDLHG